MVGCRRQRPFSNGISILAHSPWHCYIDSNRFWIVSASFTRKHKQRISRERALSDRECNAHELTLNGIMCRCALIENVTKTLAKKQQESEMNDDGSYSIGCISTWMQQSRFSPARSKVVHRTNGTAAYAVAVASVHCNLVYRKWTRENRTNIFTRRESSVFYKQQT